MTSRDVSVRSTGFHSGDKTGYIIRPADSLRNQELRI